MRRLVAVLGAAMLVAVSCSSSGTPGGGASPSAASTETPQQGGRVIEATISDIAWRPADGGSAALVWRLLEVLAGTPLEAARA